MSGIKLDEIELETIKLLPQLEKINLDIVGITGSLQDIEKLNELLLRCKNSMRKVSLSDESFQIIEMQDPYSFEMFGPKRPNLNEIIRILRDHKRTGRNGAQNVKSPSWIELEGNQWNGSSEDYVGGKMSFYY